MKTTIYVHDDGETWTLDGPTAVEVTPIQLGLIEGGEKVRHVIPDWDWTEEDRQASYQWNATEQQRLAIGRYAKRYGFKLKDVSVLMDVLGLPSGWASVALSLNDERVVCAGIAPNGRVHT